MFIYILDRYGNGLVKQHLWASGPRRNQRKTEVELTVEQGINSVSHLYNAPVINVPLLYDL